jgi:hypothetical protein
VNCDYVTPASVFMDVGCENSDRHSQALYRRGTAVD